MMNKILIVLSLVLLCGCNGGDKAKAIRKAKVPVPYGYGYHFTTDKGLDCYYISGDREGGLSCNWEKFNKVK